MREHILSVTPWEAPGERGLLKSGLDLIGVTEEERGSPAKVLAKIDTFLTDLRADRMRPRRPGKYEAHSLALELGVVIGQQFKKAGWTWAKIAWRSPVPIPELAELKGRTKDPEIWALTRDARDGFLLPIYDLMVIRLRRSVAIEVAAHAKSALDRTGTDGAMEWWRLVDPVSHG